MSIDKIAETLALTMGSLSSVVPDGKCLDNMQKAYKSFFKDAVKEVLAEEINKMNSYAETEKENLINKLKLMENKNDS